MRTNKQYFVWVLISCLCVVYSCSDTNLNELESNLPDELPNLASVETIDPSQNETNLQITKELTKLLMEWGKELLVAAKDPKAKSLIYHEIKKQFDGDENVLISTMMEVSTQRNIQSLVTANEKLVAFNS